MKKRVLIIGLSLLGILAAATATIYYLAQSERGHQLVIDKSLSAMEKALDADIEIGRATGNLLGRLVWDKVRLVRDDLEVEVERISFKVDYLALRDSHLRLTGFKATNPKVVLKQTRTGEGTGADPKDGVLESDLLDDKKGEKEEGPETLPPTKDRAAPEPRETEETEWRVSLDGASLTGGSLIGLDKTLGLSFFGSLKEVSGQFDFGLGKGFRVKGGLSALTALDNKPVRVDITGGFEGHLIKASGLKINFGPGGRSSINLKGHFDPLELTGQAKYQARFKPIDLSNLLSGILPFKTDLDLMEGEFDLKGQVGYLDNLIKLTLKGDWGRTDLELRADLDPREMKLESSGRVSDLDPSWLAKITGIQLPVGKTGFKFDLAGTIPDGLSLKMAFDETALQGYGRAEKGAIQAEWKSGILETKISLSGVSGFKAGIEKLELDGSLDSGTTRVKVAFTKATGYKAQADSGRFDLIWENNTLNVSDLELTRDQGNLTGSLSAVIEQGRIASGRADLNLAGLNPPAGLLDLLGLYLPLIDLSSVRLTGPLKARWPGKEMEFNFPGMRLDSRWGKIEGPGMIRLTDQGGLKEYALDLDVTKFAVPGWLWPFLPMEIKRSVLNGRLKVKGDSGKAIFEADLGGTRIGGEEIAEFRMAGKYDSKGAILDRLALSFLGNSITAQGPLWPTTDLRTEINGSQPERVVEYLRGIGFDPGPLPLSIGEYGFKGVISGKPLEPGIKGVLKITDLAWEQYRVKSMDLDLDLERIDLTALEIPKGKVRADIRQIALADRPKLDLNVTAASTAAGVKGDIKAALAGLRAESGWVLALNPDKGLGLTLDELRITLPKGRGSETWRSVRPLELSLLQGAFGKAELHLAGPAGQSVDLALSHQAGLVSGQGELKKLDLASWAKALGLDKVDHGRLSAALELSGSWDNPSAKLEGRVEDLAFLGKTTGDIDWTINLENSRLTAGLEGRDQSRDFLFASAEINLLPGFKPDLRSLKAEIDINGLDLAPWAAALQDDRLKEGRLYTRLNLTGPPEDIRAELKSRVEGLVLLDQRVGDLFFMADLKNRQLTAQAEIRDKALSLLKASGSMAISGGDSTGSYRPDLNSIRADINIKDLDLSRFGPAIRKIEGLSGKMNAELNLAPKPKGWIKVEGLEFRVAATGQALENGRLKLGLDRTRVSVEECFAETGGGTLTGEGWLDLSKNIPFNLKADLSKAVLLLGPIGRSTIKARVAITQDLTSPLISGQIKLDDLHFRAPKSSLEESNEIILVDEEINGRKTPAPPERLQMDLELDLGEKTPIRGEGLKAKIGGRLKIHKQPGQTFRVIGEVDFKEGLYARFGRRFIIQRGEILFNGQEEPDPAINIAATTRVNSVDIDLGIGGTVKKPDYILSSRPVMDREEILAYLIFGQSASGSSQAENGKIEARTVGILGGPATELVKGIVSEKLAPDSMTVSASSKGGVALEAGKQLLPNLFFSYVAYSEPTKPNEFKIEYRFSPNVALESNLGDPETIGVDINFKYDF